jgi:hypothetical protein
MNLYFYLKLKAVNKTQYLSIKNIPTKKNNQLNVTMLIKNFFRKTNLEQVVSVGLEDVPDDLH